MEVSDFDVHTNRIISNYIKLSYNIMCIIYDNWHIYQMIWSALDMWQLSITFVLCIL